MILKRLNLENCLIIVSNAVPIFGVIFLGWSARDVFLAYALETIIIGVFTAAKIALTAMLRKQIAAMFLYTAFFIFHFGLFAVVQITLFLTVSNVHNFFFNAETGPYFQIDFDVVTMLVGFALAFIFGNLIPFFTGGDYRTVPLFFIMFQPYGRIVIQQFTVILGSTLLLFGFGKVFVLIFMVIKTFVEIVADFGPAIVKATKKWQMQRP